MDGDLDAVAVAGESLVDRVVDNLIHQMVQASWSGGANVHARTLADGLKALEDLNLPSAIVVVVAQTFSFYVVIGLLDANWFASAKGPETSENEANFLFARTSIIPRGSVFFTWPKTV